MKVVLMMLSLFSGSAWAVIDGHKYPFDDVESAARFEQLSEDLRCPKCQNQNLADSNSPVAADLRDKVYELMQEGQSDTEIVDYLVARYGDFVRYKPPFRLDTFLLWAGPAILFGFGLLLIIGLRRQQKQPTAELTVDEQARLDEIKAKLKNEAPLQKDTQLHKSTPSQKDTGA